MIIMTITKLNNERVIGIFAPSGYGKTYLLMEILKNIKTPIIYYDTDGEIDKIKANLEQHNINALIFSPPNDERSTDLNYLNEWILGLRAKYSNIFVVIDDLDLFFDAKTSISQSSKQLLNIASTSRHQRIGIIYCAKQLKYIPLKLISNTNLFYIGNFIEQGDLARVNPLIKPFDARNLKKYSSANPSEFVKLDRWAGIKELTYV